MGSDTVVFAFILIGSLVVNGPSTPTWVVVVIWLILAGGLGMSLLALWEDKPHIVLDKESIYISSVGELPWTEIKNTWSQQSRKTSILFLETHTGKQIRFAASGLTTHPDDIRSYIERRISETNFDDLPSMSS